MQGQTETTKVLSAPRTSRRLAYLAEPYLSTQTLANDLVETLSPFLSGHKNLLPHRVKTNNVMGKEAKTMG